MPNGQSTSFPETALYPPVKAFLEAQGFTVRAEVHGRDVVAVRPRSEPMGAEGTPPVRFDRRSVPPPEELVVVELKRQFSLALVFQGIDSQRSCESVYLAVPAPVGRRQANHWRDALRLCQRLGLGLIGVHLSQDSDHGSSTEGAGSVDVALDPGGPQLHLSGTTSRLGGTGRRRGKSERSRMIREVSGRSGDHNLGGTTRRPLVTAYREFALRLARALALADEASPKVLRAALAAEAAELAIMAEPGLAALSSSSTSERGAKPPTLVSVGGAEDVASAANKEGMAEAVTSNLDPATAAELARIGAILQRNHYGWFARAARGVYRLTPAGQAALVEYARVLDGPGSAKLTDASSDVSSD